MSASVSFKKGDIELFRKVFELNAFEPNDKQRKIMYPKEIQFEAKQWDILVQIAVALKGLSKEAQTKRLREYKVETPEYNALTFLKLVAIQQNTPLLTLPDNAMATIVKQVLKTIESGDIPDYTPSILGERILSVKRLQSASRESNQMIEPILKHIMPSLMPSMVIHSLPLGCYYVDSMKDGSWLGLHNLIKKEVHTYSFMNLKIPEEKHVFQHLDTEINSRQMVYNHQFYGKTFFMLTENTMLWHTPELNKTFSIEFVESQFIYAVHPSGDIIAIHAVNSVDELHIYIKTDDNVHFVEYDFNGEYITKILFSPDGNTLSVYTYVDDMVDSFHYLYFMTNYKNPNEANIQKYENKISIETIDFGEDHDFGIKQMLYHPDGKHFIYSIKIGFEDEYIYCMKKKPEGLEWEKKRLYTLQELNNNKNPYHVFLNQFILKLVFTPEGDLGVMLKSVHKMVFIKGFCSGKHTVYVMDLEPLNTSGLQIYFYKQRWMIIASNNKLYLYVYKDSQFLKKPYIILENVKSIKQSGDDLYYFNKDVLYRYSMKQLDEFVFENQTGGRLRAKKNGKIRKLK
jgi:hypothetical protein